MSPGSPPTHFRPATYAATDPDRPGGHHPLRARGDVRPAGGALVPPRPGALRARAAARGPRGRPAAQRPPCARSRLRAAALGPLLHDGQHAPGARGGGLHRGGLRGPHAHHLRRAGRAGVGPRAAHARRRPPPHARSPRRRRGGPARPHLLRRLRRPLPRRAPGRGARGLPDALLVGNDGAPEGRAAPPERPAVRHLRHPRPDAGRGHGLRRGRRLPEPGTPVPLGPARLVDDRVADGRVGRAHGAIRPRGLSLPDRASTG